MSRYNKKTLNEYIKTREEILKNMSKYIRGELKGENLDNFKNLNKKAAELQIDLDRQYLNNNK